MVLSIEFGPYFWDLEIQFFRNHFHRTVSFEILSGLPRRFAVMLSWGRSDLCFCWCMAFPFWHRHFFFCVHWDKQTHPPGPPCTLSCVVLRSSWGRPDTVYCLGSARRYSFEYWFWSPLLDLEIHFFRNHCHPHCSILEPLGASHERGFQVDLGSLWLLGCQKDERRRRRKKEKKKGRRKEEGRGKKKKKGERKKRRAKEMEPWAKEEGLPGRAASLG